jgi:hypothetical protein
MSLLLLWIGQTCLFTWRTSIDDFLQLGLDGQAFEHADVSSARVARWNDTDCRAQRSQNDACQLTHNRREPASLQLYSEHQPMRCDVRYDVTLADNVSSLEVGESCFQVASGNEPLRLSDFIVEGRAPDRVHYRFRRCDYLGTAATAVSLSGCR